MKQHWRSNSSFINFVRHIRQLLWAPSLLHSFVLCLVGDCGKIVIFAVFAKFAAFANFYGPPSLLCVLPRWRLWQNCHFRHICQMRRFRQLLWGPYTALCFASLAIVAKLSFSPYLPNSPLSPTFMGPFHCFVLCLVGDCGKIVIFAIFAKFAAFANFYGAPSLLCALPRWRLWQNCHFRHIYQIRRFRQLLWGPYTALCFASLAIVAKLSFSPYLPNSPLSPTFMGPLHCFFFFLVGDFGKIVIFAIFAKFAAFANFYGAPSLLCVLPRWRLWQNCHFRHICQTRRFRQLLWGPYTALCFASLAIVAKLSFSPYLPNSPLSPTFMGPLHCFVLCLVGDCGKIVIFAIFAKFANIIFFLQFLLLCAFLDISHPSKILGHTWNKEEDTLEFPAKPFAEDQPVTKRTILSYLGAIHDPRGIVSPTMAQEKHIYRQACDEKKGWNAEVSSQLRDEWFKWTKQLKTVEIPRSVATLIGEITGMHLHLFADASNLACCAATVAVVEQHV